MMDKVDEAIESRLKALEEIEKEKVKIAKAYNKRVVEKSFQVVRVVPGNAYFMEDLEGHSLPKALNGKYLKWYYPSMWQDR
jgi:restriction endonuclease S subunit